MITASNKPLTEKQNVLLTALLGRRGLLGQKFTAHEAFPDPTAANRANRLMLNGIAQKGYLDKQGECFSLTGKANEFHSMKLKAKDDQARQRREDMVWSDLLAGKHLFAEGHNHKTGAVRKIAYSIEQGMTISFSRFPKHNPHLSPARTALNWIAEASEEISGRAAILSHLGSYAPIERWAVKFAV